MAIKNRRQGLLGLIGLLAALACGGCVSHFNDQVALPGGNQRLVVGSKQAFWGAKAKIWLLENGQFSEVKVVEK